jgi:hypothetical protein
MTTAEETNATGTGLMKKIKIPESEMQIKFGDIIKYFSERIEQEINLRLLAKDALTPLGEQKQKHEEIKRMAWDMYSRHLFNNDISSYTGKKIIITHKLCWEEAEEFYNYAKNKEEEDNETTR